MTGSTWNWPQYGKHTRSEIKDLVIQIIGRQGDQNMYF